MIDRRAFYEQRAPLRARETDRYYQRELRKYFNFLVPPGRRVLEIGCGLGDLLAAMKPGRGVGVDFSPAMLELARRRHPELEFQVADALEFSSPEKFDYILLSDLVNDLPDVQAVLERLQAVSTPETRLVINFFNNLWRPVLQVSEKLGFKAPTLLQNWLSTDDMSNLLYLAGWEVIKTDTRILWPAGVPLVAPLLNRWLAPLLPDFCVTVALVARPRPRPATRPQYRCSVVDSRPQRSGQHRGRRAAHAGNGPGHRNHFYRGTFQGQYLGGNPARCRPIPATQY